MSTIFAVRIPSTGAEIPVAKRSNGGDVRFINPIAELLNDEMPVMAIDNTPQGIFTIRDVKDNITGMQNA